MKGETAQAKHNSNGKFCHGIQYIITYVNDLQVSVE